MNDDTERLRALLGHHDPARTRPSQPSRDPGSVLAQVVAAPRDATGRRSAVRGRSLGRSPGRARRRFRGAAAGLIAVAVACLVVLGVNPVGRLRGGGDQSAGAATPPMLAYRVAEGTAKPAGPLLERVADAAARQPQPAGTAGDGGYWYSRSEGWTLNSTVGDGLSASAVVPTVLETWTRPDGSGRLVERQGALEFSNGEQRGLWQRLRQRTDATTRTEDLPPPAPGGLVPAGVTKLSTDPAMLARQFLTDRLQGNSPDVPDSVERFYAARTLLMERQPLTPGLRAAVLRVLARDPAVRDLGRVTDRAGRAGVAVAVSDASGGLPESLRMILDPATGHLLGFEEVLTTDPGALGVAVPAVIGYETLVRSGGAGQLGQPT